MPKKYSKALPKGDIILYGGKGKAPRLDVRLTDETVWLSQAQIAELFDIDRSSITKHVRNIIKVGELSEKSNVQFLHIGVVYSKFLDSCQYV